MVGPDKPDYSLPKGCLYVILWNVGIVGIIAGLYWLGGPPAINSLRTGKSCVEVSQRLMKDRSHSPTDNEMADMRQCSEP
jgi:hypothetical protein